MRRAAGMASKGEPALTVYAYAEHLEPEDKALKARVESLKRQVKDTATRVRAQRTTVPAEMKQQVHASLQQAAAALEASLVPSSSEQPAASQPKTPVTISKAVGAAFVHDTVDLTRRSALLRKSLPEQVPLCPWHVHAGLYVGAGWATGKVTSKGGGR